MPPDPPLPQLFLDSQSLRRLALQIKTEADHLLDGIESDRAGLLSAQNAAHVIRDCESRLIEIIRNLRPLHDIAQRTAFAVAVDTAVANALAHRSQT